MIRFKEFCTEVTRTTERATKLVNYVHKRQLDSGKIRPIDYAHGQMLNTIPKTHPDDVIPDIVHRHDNPKLAHNENPKPKRLMARLSHIKNYKSGSDAWARFSGPDSRAKLEHVPIHKIVSTQRTVSSDVVKQKIHGDFKDHFPEHPYFFHHEASDKYHQVDGNHRTNEAKFKGDKHIRGLVIKV